MSEVFFRELGMPAPARQPRRRLGVARGADRARSWRPSSRCSGRARRPACWSPATSTRRSPCALVAVKLGVPVAHLEAGLRSFDRTMPEEINRILTDAISDLLLTPSADADDNLAREGADGAVVRVGNAMIDSVLAHLARARGGGTLAGLGLHRARLRRAHVAPRRPTSTTPRRSPGCSTPPARWPTRLPLVFPVHPRTRARIDALGDGAARRHPPSSSRSATSTSSPSRPGPAWCSPTAAACRRRPPRSACRA